MKSNILEQGGLWDVSCLGGSQRLIEAVYLEREGESLFWDSVKQEEFGKENLKQFVEMGKGQKLE